MTKTMISWERVPAGKTELYQHWIGRCDGDPVYKIYLGPRGRGALLFTKGRRNPETFSNVAAAKSAAH